MGKKLFLIAFIFACLVFLAHFWVVGSAAWGDGRYYYSYTRSLIIDKDLDFSNELSHFEVGLVYTKIGKIANKYSLGPGLFWLPFFVLAHLLARGDGYSYAYQILVGAGCVIYGILGLWFCYKTAKRYFSEKIALVATLSLWLASNLFFYTAVDPINSHAVSFFVASLVVYFWLGGLGRLGILGVLVGFLGMVRVQDLVFVIPLVFFFKNWRKIAGFLSGVFWGFLPQLLVWKFLYGEWRSPYLISGEKFYWQLPQVWSVFFSRDNGLFYYSPILVLALLGLIWIARKYLWAVAGIVLFLAESYIISCWRNWQVGTYGGRMFISLMPFFILGLAAFLDKVKNLRKIMIIIIINLIILNFYSMVNLLIKY